MVTQSTCACTPAGADVAPRLSRRTHVSLLDRHRRPAANQRGERVRSAATFPGADPSTGRPPLSVTHAMRASAINRLVALALLRTSRDLQEARRRGGVTR